MLESLDVIIALVTYLTLCSVFVLIIVQLLSALFSLRGKNLANGLALTLEKIAPGLDEKAQALAKKILTDPLVSDSINTPKGYGPKAKDAASWGVPMPLLGLRWVFGKLTSFHLTNAIRPEEAYGLLKELAAKATQADGSMDPNAEPLLQDAWTVIDKIENKNPKVAEMVEKINALDTILSTVAPAQAAAAKAQALQAIAGASASLVKEIDSAQERFAKLFDAGQDRAEQWFRTHTRGFTIVVSILFALAFRIDGIELYGHVSSNATAREALVKAGTELAGNEAFGVLGEKGNVEFWVRDEWNNLFPENKIDPALTLATVKEVRAAAEKLVPPADKIAALVTTLDGEIKTTRPQAIKAAKAAKETAATKAKTDETALTAAQAGTAKKIADAQDQPAKDAATTEGAQKEAPLKAAAQSSADDLKNQVENLAKAEAALANAVRRQKLAEGFQKKSFVDAFAAVHDVAFQKHLDAEVAVAKRIQSISEAADYPIIPRGWTFCQWEQANPDDWRSGWKGLFSSHFWGVLLFAALLTLGAPYWFNLLKNLASLRPAVAQMIQGEKQAAKPAPPAAPQ